MIADWVGGAVGAYAITVMLAIAVGMTIAGSSRSSRASAFLTIAAFTVLAFGWFGAVPWSAPIFAIVAVLTGILASAHGLRTHPALEGEAYWRRVILVSVHG